MSSSRLTYPTQKTTRNTVRNASMVCNAAVLTALLSCLSDDQRVFHEAGFDAYCVGFGGWKCVHEESFVTFTPLLCSVPSHCASAGYERYEVGSKLPAVVGYIQQCVCAGPLMHVLCM